MSSKKKNRGGLTRGGKASMAAIHNDPEKNKEFHARSGQARKRLTKLRDQSFTLVRKVAESTLPDFPTITTEAKALVRELDTPL